MKETGSWIKLFRSVQENWLWREKPFSKGQAWVDLLLLAQSQDGKFLDSRGNLIDGKRGMVYRSERWLAQRWGWSRKKVDRFLSQLCLDGALEVSKNRTGERTTIKIVNYSAYQDSRTNKRTIEEPLRNQSGTTQEHKQELQNDIITESKESVREKTPPSDSIRLFEDLRMNYELSDAVTESLRSWVRYKSERRESYKEQGMKSLLSQVSKHAAESGDEAVCNLIEMCMSNGWKGIIWDRLPKTEQKGEDSAEDWTDTDDFYKRYLGDDP